jgi:hypothetical protein
MKLKALILISTLMTVVMAGCTSSRLATGIGVRIGAGYQTSAQDGLAAAESIKAWPYVSGQIRGIYANDYETELPVKVQQIIDALDVLAAKEELTDREKGEVIGYYVRLEALALEFGWNKYGVSIYRLIAGYLGG